MQYSIFFSPTGNYHADMPLNREADKQSRHHTGTPSFLEGVHYVEEEFYEVVRAEFGSRGVREAQKDIPRFIECLPEDAKQDTDAYRDIFQVAWLTAKREARKTFTPRKYRYWEQ